MKKRPGRKESQSQDYLEMSGLHDAEDDNRDGHVDDNVVEDVGGPGEGVCEAWQQCAGTTHCLRSPLLSLGHDTQSPSRHMTGNTPTVQTEGNHKNIFSANWHSWKALSKDLLVIENSNQH